MSRIFNGRLGAYLQLIRLPNIFTAIADVLAGYLIVSGENIHWLSLLCLMAASACIYGGGCVFNDYCDYELDLQERPARPIPSGKVSKKEGIILAQVLFGVGIGFAAMVNSKTTMLSILLVGLVIVYDRFSKDILVLGSFNMALCRGCNILLGMLVGSVADLWIFFAAISTWYVFWLTSLSKFETSDNLGKYKWIIVVGLSSVGAVLVILIVQGFMQLVSIIYLCLLIGLIGGPVGKWINATTPRSTGSLVKYLVLGIPVLDSIYVAGVQGPILAIPVLFCSVSAILVAKYFYVT